MKLAIIVTSFPRTTETFIMRDVVTFLEHGHDVRLYHILPFDHSQKLHAFAAAVASRARTVPFFSRRVLEELVRTSRNEGSAYWGIVKALFRKTWRDPAVLLKSLFILPKSLVFARELQDWGADHVHGEFAGHPTTCAWMIHRMTGITYSASCRAHDIFVTQTLLGLTVGEANAVRTITRYNIEFLRERVPELRHRKIDLIHSSINVKNIEISTVNHRQIFSILYVGSLQARKGVDDLLHALVHFSPPDPWQLTVIGDGPERRRLERLAMRLRISQRVRFLGAQPFEAVTLAYRDTHLVVVPSRYGRQGRTEGIPNVVIEALAHQRPVISTRVSGIPELVENGLTGLLVEPNDRVGLAEAIATVYRDRDAADRMAKRGRARIESEFDLERNAAAQLAMFHEAIDTAQTRLVIGTPA
jgi:glycosyltransferase involved in cell wall biosynthesis